MAYAATAFASAGDAYAFDWMSFGRWTVLVICGMALAAPLVTGLRRLARLAVPALFAFLLLGLGIFATTPNGGVPTREEKERLRAELAAAEAERAALGSLLTGGTRSGDATNDVPAFAFNMVGKETNRVDLASAWTPEYVFSAIGLYYSRWIESNDWARIDLRTDVSGETNCSWTITDPTIVTNNAAFFDARGFLANDDSDADGVVAQREVALGLDPDLADTDGDLLTDGEELGCATVLTGEDFLWLDVSNGLQNVTHYRALSASFDFFWLMDEYPMSMLGVDCNEFDVYENGFVIIARDSAGVEPSDGFWDANGDLRFDPRSGGATVVAAVNYDMHSSGVRCAGIVETNGTSYAVYRVESQTASIPGVNGERSVTYEVIVPFNETNTVYVSYLEVDDAFAALGMDLGVQCPSMQSALDASELYVVPCPPGALRPRTTVKYVLGRNTDPNLSDTDGDGIPDGYSLVSSFDADGDGLVDSLDLEPAVYGGDFHGQSAAWVQATFTNADEILSVGYPQWVDAQVGVCLANGLYKLSVSVTNMPVTATYLSVGGYEVMVDAPCELVFPLEVFEEYGICVSAPLEAGWTIDDGFDGEGVSFRGAFAAPSPGVAGSLSVEPLVMVDPPEVGLDAAEGAELTAAWNVASASFTWVDQGGTAEFADAQTNVATIVSAPDATVISVVATDGTHSATGTVGVTGLIGGLPPGPEAREDASLGWENGVMVTGTAIHPDTLRTTWCTAVGDLAAGEPKTVTNTVAIPAGRTCYVGAFALSSEYPDWTGDRSRYNDVVYWNVTTGGATSVISSSRRVNSLHAEFAAAAAGEDEVNNAAPAVFLDGAFVSAPTNAPISLRVLARAQNVGDAKRPSALSVGVFPLSVIQANHPRTTGAGGTTDSALGGTNAVIVGEGVAYVTGLPEAAELTARVLALPQWMKTKWGGSLTSERSERGALDDRELVEATTSGSGSFDIKAALTNEIIGGRLDLRMQVSNTVEKVVPFFIRGKNPLDAIARAYIDANVDEEFRSYAWMIAKHESKLGDRVYNQFNPSGSRKELPNWGLRTDGACVRLTGRRMRSQIMLLTQVRCTTGRLTSWRCAMCCVTSGTDTRKSFAGLGRNIKMIILHNGLSLIMSRQTLAVLSSLLGSGL